MATPPFLFDEESAGRIIDAVRYVEGAPQSRRPQRGAGDGGAAAGVYFARVTGAVDGSGYYPAVITRLNTADQTYTDFAGCFVKAPNGEALPSTYRFAVKPAGSYSGSPAYESLGGGGFTGTRTRVSSISCVAGVTTFVAYTDTYINGLLQTSV